MAPRHSFINCARSRFSMAMKALCLILLIALGVSTARADKAVTFTTGSTGTGKSVARGATYVLFDLVGFTGTIGGTSFSNITLLLPIPALQDGQTLSAIPYSVTSGSLIIIETR